MWLIDFKIDLLKKNYNLALTHSKLSNCQRMLDSPPLMSHMNTDWFVFWGFDIDIWQKDKILNTDEKHTCTVRVRENLGLVFWSFSV